MGTIYDEVENMKEKWNKNSLCYWFPKIKDLGIRVPDTEIVEVDWKVCADLLDGIPMPADIEGKLSEARHKIGYPCFMRTDLCSGKHEYEQTCYLKDKDSFYHNFLPLVEANLIADLLFGAIVFREFIELDWKFKAFKGLPIAPEWRVFVEGGNVKCSHFYWPEDAIRFWTVEEPENWEEQLKVMSVLGHWFTLYLFELAESVSQAVPGYWSVDFARAKSGGWVLIDMATGDSSFHPPCDRWKHGEKVKLRMMKNEVKK